MMDNNSTKRNTIDWIDGCVLLKVIISQSFMMMTSYCFWLDDDGVMYCRPTDFHSDSFMKQQYINRFTRGFAPRSVHKQMYGIDVCCFDATFKSNSIKQVGSDILCPSWESDISMYVLLFHKAITMNICWFAVHNTIVI
jgi:hypothetical protein